MSLIEFDPANTAAIHDDIQNALNTIADRYGLKHISFRQFKYNHFRITAKIEALINVPIDISMLKSKAAHYSLSAEMIDFSFVVGKKQLRIIDFEPGINPIVAEDISTFDRYKLSIKQVLSAERGSFIGVGVEDSQPAAN